jgi:hypothetical protein
MYRDYKVEFSYRLATGKRRTEHDTTFAASAQEAVDRVREWYGDLVGFRIEVIYADRGNCWSICDDWD